MSSKLEQNRETLANLIFSKDTFTEDELIEEFRRENDGDIVIGSDNVSDYLDTLREIRAIRFENGRFSPTVNGNGKEHS